MEAQYIDLKIKYLNELRKLISTECVADPARSDALDKFIKTCDSIENDLGIK